MCLPAHLSHKGIQFRRLLKIYFATIFKLAIVLPCVYQEIFPKTETAGASGQKIITFLPQSCVSGYIWNMEQNNTGKVTDFEIRNSYS
jgi:hypothetical protein